MAVTNLGPCEWFVWDIRRSHVMDLETVDQAATAFLAEQPEGEPPAFAQYLVAQKLLTPFQADRLLQGKSQDLVLGPYTLLEAVGTGSMGTVYRAVSSKDHKPYAVKVLPRRSMWNARMARRQVATFEKCNHTAVVPFVDVGTAGAMHYLAWPFVEGESLQNLIQRTGRLEPMVATDYALQTAQGLAICHQNGLIHGMLKPSNLLVGPDQKIRILDYGVGALLVQGDSESLIDTRSTANVLAAGLDCVSPECILNPSKQSGAGDQYSLGCVLYFCLTGRLPFEGSASEKIQAHQSKEPDPIQTINPEVPEVLAKVVHRLMQKEPGGRYFDMNQVIAALSSVVMPVADSATADTTVMSEPSTPTTRENQTLPVDHKAASPLPAPILETSDAKPPQSEGTLSGTGPIPVDRDSTTIIPTLNPESPCDSFLLPSFAPCDLSLDSPVCENKGPAPISEPETSQNVAPPLPKESGITALPPGTTQVLGKVNRRAASEFSVFDMPPLNFPEVPSRSGNGQPNVAAPKLQVPNSPEGLIPIKEEVNAAQPAIPRQESTGLQPSIEERLGKNGTMILTLIAGVVAFLLFLLFKP